MWAGAGLLGWVAGEMLITDPWLVKTLGEKMVHSLELPTAAIGAALVVATGFILNKLAASAPRSRENKHENGGFSPFHLISKQRFSSCQYSSFLFGRGSTPSF